MTTPTAWDRQRAAVRAEIAETALALFLDQGFERTSIDEIVARVGVSRRSFFRYFGTKEDIVLGDLMARGEAIAAELAVRPAGEDPWQALRGAFRASAEVTMPDPAAALRLGRMLHDTPSLRSRLIEKRLRWHGLFVPLIAARLGADHPRPEFAAAAIVAAALSCLDTASDAWITSGGDGDLAELYDEAVAALRA